METYLLPIYRQPISIYRYIRVADISILNISIFSKWYPILSVDCWVSRIIRTQARSAAAHSSRCNTIELEYCYYYIYKNNDKYRTVRNSCIFRFLKSRLFFPHLTLYCRRPEQSELPDCARTSILGESHYKKYAAIVPSSKLSLKYFSSYIIVIFLIKSNCLLLK